MSAATDNGKYQGRSVLDFSTDAALRKAISRSVVLGSSEQSIAHQDRVDTEVVRLRSLKDSRVLQHRPTLDDLTETLRSKLNVTWVAACFVDLDCVTIPSTAEHPDFPFGVQSGDVTPRLSSFADISVRNSSKALEVIPDTLLDDRVNKGPWVVGHPKVRFFAGVPLMPPGTRSRQRLGSLCVLDNKPHPEGLTPLQELEMQTVATQIAKRCLGKERSPSQSKRRPRSSSDNANVSFNRSPSPKRQDRSRSSSPIGGPPVQNLPCPTATNVDPDAYLSQLVAAMTGGKELKIQPSASVSDFFLEVTEDHTSRYCTKVVSMARNNDVPGLRELYESQGRDALDCYNRFGEGLLTLACRRGFKDMVELLLSPGVDLSVRLRDDYGRTVVHDACWNPEPQLEICSWLLQREPSLFLLSDKRGFSPFQYARKSDWHVWRQFLFDNKEHLLVLANSDKVSMFTVG